MPRIISPSHHICGNRWTHMSLLSGLAVRRVIHSLLGLPYAALIVCERESVSIGFQKSAAEREVQSAVQTNPRLGVNVSTPRRLAPRTEHNTQPERRMTSNPNPLAPLRCECWQGTIPRGVPASRCATRAPRWSDTCSASLCVHRAANCMVRGSSAPCGRSLAL